MRETRSEKSERFLAAIVACVFQAIPKPRRREYISRFTREIETYSTKPRRKGSPRNEGCVRELEEYDDPDVSDPILVARTIKEEWHRHYQKQSTARGKDAFLKAISKY